MDYRALVQKLGDRTNQNSQTSELILEHRTGHPNYINKLSNLIDDDTKRITMSDAASKYVARFDVKTIADRWEYILESL